MYHFQYLAFVPFLVLVAKAAESVEPRPLREALYEGDDFLLTFQVSIEVFQLELQGEVKARTIDVPVTAPPFSDQVQGPVFIQSIRQNWIGTEAENGKDALFAMNRVIVLSDYIAGGEDGLGKCSFPSEDEKVCFVNLGETSPADDPVNIDCSGVRDKLGVALPEGAKEGAYPANAIAFSGPSWDEVAEYSDNRR